MGGKSTDYRSVKRMRALKTLREKKKKDALKDLDSEEEKKPRDPEDLKRLLKLWEDTKKKNEEQK